MSSPKLRVIFRPKSEIQALFSPEIRWSPKKKKKKRSSPKLRVIFRPKSEIQAFFSPKIRWSPKKKRDASPPSPPPPPLNPPLLLSLLFELIAFCFFEFKFKFDLAAFFEFKFDLAALVQNVALFFNRKFTKLVTIVSFFVLVASAVATVGPRGAVPPLTTACAPHFGLLRMRFWSIT